jgi:hypothetical protein
VNAPRAQRFGVGLVFALAVLNAVPAGASTTAEVQIVDHYGYGPVKVWVNHTTHRLDDNHRTGWFAITPSSSHNDGVSVTSVRYSGCGVGEPGWFFHAGHQYKIVIRSSVPPDGRCSVGGGKTVPGPEFAITKIS